MTLAPGSTAPMLVDDRLRQAPIARFVYGPGAPARPAPLPDPKPLPANPLPHAWTSAARSGAICRSRTVRRQLARPRTPPRLARVWSTAVLGQARPHRDARLPNRTALRTCVHLHGHAVRLLDNLDDGWKPFWLDTVLVAPQQTARIAFVADNPGKWLIHCHMLDSATRHGRVVRGDVILTPAPAA